MLLSLALTSCLDFDLALQQCVDSGRCGDAGSAMGGGAATGGGGAATGGGNATGGGGATGGGTATGGGSATGGGNATGGGSATGGGAGCPGITVVAFDHALVDGPSELINPLPAYRLLVADDGGTTRADPTAVDAGVWCFSEAPGATRWLEIDHTLKVQATSSFIDASRWHRGRPNRVRSTGYSVTAPLGTLSPPWLAGSEGLEVVSDGANVTGFVSPTFADGETNAGNVQFDLTDDGLLALTDASQGDVLTFLRRRTNTPRFSVTIASAQGEATAMTAQNATVTTSGFTAVNLTSHLSATWSKPTSRVAAMYPFDGGIDGGSTDVTGVLSPSDYADINLRPDPHDAGYVEPTTALVGYIDLNGGITSLPIELDYGNPFPGPMSITALFGTFVRVRHPTAFSSAAAGVSLFMVRRHVATNAGAFDFPLAPASAVQLNGVSVSERAWGETLTRPLVVDWSASAMVNQVRLELMRIDNSAGNTVLTTVAELVLEGAARTVEFPETIGSGTFILRLTMLRLAPAPGNTPLRAGADVDSASMLSRPFVLP